MKSRAQRRQEAIERAQAFYVRIQAGGEVKADLCRSRDSFLKRYPFPLDYVAQFSPKWQRVAA